MDIKPYKTTPLSINMRIEVYHPEEMSLNKLIDHIMANSSEFSLCGNDGTVSVSSTDITYVCSPLD